MQIDNILVLSPPDYTHSQALFEVALSFQAALKSLGNDVQILLNPSQCSDGTTLVFGAHLISKYGGVIDGEPDEYIIYQTEQVGASDSVHIDAKYLDILKRFPVWDYSMVNIMVLATHGIHALHVPIGYNKVMENINTGRSASIVGGARNGKQRVELVEWSGVYPQSDHVTGRIIEDVDVCFAGIRNERRTNIIDILKGAEVNGKPLVVANFIGYGGFRDKIIARSKIVLNMHYYDSAIFEIFRCSHLFANKKCVVSETGNDMRLEDIYHSTGGFTTYDKLVGKCLSLLGDSAQREKVAEKGYEIFKQASPLDILRKVLNPC